jgi:hypothetical protein
MFEPEPAFAIPRAQQFPPQLSSNRFGLKEGWGAASEHEWPGTFKELNVADGTVATL